MSNSINILNRMLQVGKVLKIDNGNHKLSLIPFESVTDSDDIRLIFTIDDLLHIFHDCILEEITIDIIIKKMPKLNMELNT